VLGPAVAVIGWWLVFREDALLWLNYFNGDLRAHLHLATFADRGWGEDIDHILLEVDLARCGERGKDGGLRGQGGRW